MEKVPCRIGVVPARAFLRAAEIWDVRIGVYNIRSMAGNAIMNGETRYLTEKEAVHTVECWGPIPQEPAMRSFYITVYAIFREMSMRQR